MEDDEIGKVEEAALRYFTSMTPAQYLEWEDQQELKHEYVEGEIITMQGASWNHNSIVSNIIGEVGHFLKGKRCRVLPSDLRISAKSRRSYFYPDATIFCGDPEVLEEAGHTFKNPAVIFEVLSPSTADYDLGRKLFFYMQIESLNEYIIIDSRKIEIRIGRRQIDNSWKFETLNGMQEVLLIQTIGMSLKIAEIYSGVSFKS